MNRNPRFRSPLPARKPDPGESPFENYGGHCFRVKGRMARHDEGEYPWWIFD